MGWRESMGPASFRGVAFFVETSDFSGGRRAVVHEYPLRDQPFSEDMGRRARSFNVEGYVVGTEYLLAKEALLTELEREGPGDLVHPYFGSRYVSVVNFRVAERARDGGFAEFSIEFVETSAQNSQPTAVIDTGPKAIASAALAGEAAAEEFSASYTVGPLLDSVGTSLRSAMVAVDNALTTVQVEAQRLATLKRQIVDLSDSVESLARAPEDMAFALVDLFDLLDSVPALLAIYAFDPGPRPPATTPNRAAEQACFDATQRLIQRLAVIRAARVAIDQTFDSYEEAITARAQLTDLLDEQAELAADGTFPSLLQLRADLVKAIPSAGLPRLVSFTPMVTLPSLVLAHRLYGNVGSEADLLTRNHVRNPCLVRGGQVLEVLSDE